MTWVDFQTVRENLDVLVVLGHYGFDVKQNGQDQVKICCPFHDDKPREPVTACRMTRNDNDGSVARAGTGRSSF